MRKSFLATAAAVAALSLCASAQAGTLTFNFNGPGVSGAIDLAYGPDTDARYARALVVTSVSGTFSDSNIGISNATIGMLEPRNFATPEPTNLLAPNSFSRFAVATGLPFENHGFLTFDNLFWPGGSLPTASDYQADGGLFDIYGLLFDIGDNRVVDFWGNGGSDYGVAVATSAQSLDYVAGGVSLPEPATMTLLGLGIGVLVATRRRAA